MWYFLEEIMLPIFLIILLVCISVLALLFCFLGVVQLFNDIVCEFIDVDETTENDTTSLTAINEAHTKSMNEILEEHSKIF